MTTAPISGSIEIARVSDHNIDAALALLHTVVPQRPSLRRGHEAVSLLTGDHNLDAVRLYERHGFRMHCINRWFMGARRP